MYIRGTSAFADIAKLILSFRGCFYCSHCMFFSLDENDLGEPTHGQIIYMHSVVGLFPQNWHAALTRSSRVFVRAGKETLLLWNAFRFLSEVLHANGF